MPIRYHALPRASGNDSFTGMRRGCQGAHPGRPPGLRSSEGGLPARIRLHPANSTCVRLPATCRPRHPEEAMPPPACGGSAGSALAVSARGTPLRRTLPRTGSGSCFRARGGCPLRYGSSAVPGLLACASACSRHPCLRCAPDAAAWNPPLRPPHPLAPQPAGQAPGRSAPAGQGRRRPSPERASPEPGTAGGSRGASSRRPGTAAKRE